MAGGTTVTYSLAVDLNIPMIGMLRRKAEKVIIDTALKGLKRRVEGAPDRLTIPRRLRSRDADGAVHGQGWGREDHPRRGDGRPPRAVRAQDAGRLHGPGALAGRRAGGRPRRTSRWRSTGVDGLFAAHVDARALLDGTWGRLREHLATILAGAGVDELVADELTVLPGVEELLALAAVRRAAQSGPWDVVVVDCGPTAETLRLLALPEALSGYLERLFPAHRRAVRGLLARDRRTRGAGTAPPKRSTSWWTNSPTCGPCSPRR